MGSVPVFVLALLAPGLCAAQSASQRLERLAAEAYERALDLFPVSEIFGRGAGPRQDRFELTFTDEHRERQRAHHRWILGELERIPAGELAPTEKITHALLAWRARDALEWLAQPFHQHSAFIHLDGGVAFDLVRVVGTQPFRNEADYRAWFRRVQRYPAFFDERGSASCAKARRPASPTPRVIVERTLAQLEALAPARHDEEHAVEADRRSSRRRSDAEARSRVEADYRSCWPTEMFPALRRLAAFARNDYLPRRAPRRIRRAARRRRDVPLRRAQRHHHRADARRDPRARPAAR